MIDIQLLGKFALLDGDGNQIPVTGAKTQGLIAFLAMTVGMPPTRDRIINLFWGDRFSDQARQSLRQAIAKLRRVLPNDGPEVLIIDQDRIGLNPAAVRVDFDQFGKWAQSAEAGDISAAVALLKGPLLDGFYGQQPAFEDWIASERQRLNEMAARVLERATEMSLKAGDTDAAMAHARQLTEIDPWSDTAQMVLLRLMAQNGHRPAALQTFKAYAQTLEQELGISPGSELLELVDQIRGDGVKPPSDAPEASSHQDAPGATRGTSVALVPFAWMASEPDQGFLVDGLIEDLATKLARFGWIDIQAGGSTHGARLTGPELSALYADTDVNYVVHGSLRSHGRRYRLTVQLADPSDGRYLWVERFDREAEDIFDLQDDLSDAVVGSLECAMQRLEGHNAGMKSLDQMNAWECYHRGLAIQYEFDATTNYLAQQHFRKAISHDPNFALAHARLSYAIVLSTIYFEAPDVTEQLAEALEAAQIAARLDPDDAVVRFALGRVLLASGEYEKSISHLRDAIALNPNMAQAHCGLGDSMAYAGNLDSAMSCFERAVSVCPTDPHRWAFLSYGATALLFRGDYEEADAWAAKAEAVPNCHYWPTAIRASALAHSGRMAEAKESLSRLMDLRPGITCDFVKSRLFYLKDAAQIETYVSGLRKAGLA
ncbi:MAG: BTAD domain-containing putative transcriptional regulator [Pseudomonadota bacterium]